MGRIFPGTPSVGNGVQVRERDAEQALGGPRGRPGSRGGTANRDRCMYIFLVFGVKEGRWMNIFFNFSNKLLILLGDCQPSADIP